LIIQKNKFNEEICKKKQNMKNMTVGQLQLGKKKEQHENDVEEKTGNLQVSRRNPSSLAKKDDHNDNQGESNKRSSHNFE
jgi:hypothetical protein